MRKKENSFKIGSPELHFLIAVTTSFYEQSVSTCIQGSFKCVKFKDF